MDGIWQLALDLLTEMAENTLQHNTIISNATMSLGGWHLAAGTGPSRRDAQSKMPWQHGRIASSGTGPTTEVARTMCTAAPSFATMSACWMDGVWQLACDLLTEMARKRCSTTPAFATLR